MDDESEEFNDFYCSDDSSESSASGEEPNEHVLFLRQAINSLIDTDISSSEAQDITLLNRFLYFISPPHEKQDSH